MYSISDFCLNRLATSSSFWPQISLLFLWWCSLVLWISLYHSHVFLPAFVFYLHAFLLFVEFMFTFYCSSPNVKIVAPSHFQDISLLLPFSTLHFSLHLHPCSLVFGTISFFRVSELLLLVHVALLSSHCLFSSLSFFPVWKHVH